MFRKASYFMMAILLAIGCGFGGSFQVAYSQTETRSVHGEETRATLERKPADAERHQKWLDGLAEAGARNGCKAELIVQQPGETVEEVLRLYALTASEGSCLALFPVSTGTDPIRYSFASGGKIDGVEVYYLSDVSRIRIWTGVPVPEK